MRTPTCLLGGAGIDDRVAHGHDADRFVEIGSLTKVFTGTVLARLAAEGAVGLDTPLEECVEEVPRGTGVTLRHLAEHTSGLPRLPAGPTGPPDDPYVDFTETALRETLRDLDRLTAGRLGRRSTPTSATPCSGTRSRPSRDARTSNWSTPTSCCPSVWRRAR